MFRLFRLWVGFLDDAIRWIHRIIPVIADILAAKLRRHAKERGRWRSQYPCRYYLVSAAPDWTA